MQEMSDLKEGIAPYYYDWLSHSDYDDYWKQVCIAESHSEIAIPAFNVGGWYDIFLGGTISNYPPCAPSGAPKPPQRRACLRPRIPRSPQPPSPAPY